MNNNIEEFTKKQEPKSKLQKYSDEILYLIDYGYSQPQILQYLKEYYGVSATRQTLSSQLSYLKKTNKLVRTAQPKASESEEPKTIKKPSQVKDYSLPKTIDGDEFVRRIKKLGEPK